MAAVYTYDLGAGSGKTTLLDVLADRRRGSSFNGERRINGDTNMACVTLLSLRIYHLIRIP